jgi:hypothetical protein
VSPRYCSLVVGLVDERSLLGGESNVDPLILGFERVVKTLGALRMNARQRINGMTAYTAALPLRIKDGGVAIIVSHR